MAEHQSEMKTWNVPKSHGRWYYPGTIAVLMGVISVMGTLLHNAIEDRKACQAELREERDTNRDYLKEWADKAFDERYKEKEREINPKVEELKAAVDSIKQKL